MRKWILGLLAAVVVAVIAGVITIAIDDEAPYVLIGAFWGVLAFFVGAAGAERYSGSSAGTEFGRR